jgi:replicative DNA helicase
MNAADQVPARGRADNVIETMQPPSSLECETALISGVLTDETGGALSIAQQAGVRPAAFYSPANVQIWTTLETLADRRVPLTTEALAVELQAVNKLEAVGGLAYLLQVTRSEATSAHVRHYAEELTLLWSRRHALVLAGQLREYALNYTERQEFTTNCAELGRRLVGLGQRAESRTLEERIDAVKADVAARAAGKEDKSGWILTRMATVDERLRPFNSAKEDQVIVVAGGSGEGKSALMRQWGCAALAQDMRVVMFTRETTTDGCIEQMASTVAAFDLMNPTRMLAETVQRFGAVCDEMRDKYANRTLFCYEHSATTPLLTVEDLVARMRHHCFTYGTPHLVVVDYLQLFGTKRRLSSREQEVAHVSHELQALAREVGGAWLIGCQMNEKGLAEMRQIRRERGADGKEGKVIHRIPNAGDLRESQAIYHDADRVIAIYRPPVDSTDKDQTGPNIDKPEQWLCQIKRRKGRTGVVKCWFEKAYTRFIELPNFTHASAGGTGSGMTKAQFRGERGGAS